MSKLSREILQSQNMNLHFPRKDPRWEWKVFFPTLKWRTKRYLELSPIPRNGTAAQNFNNQCLGNRLTSGSAIFTQGPERRHL
jgi:hypothetical protein